jgi:hypothetical protein
MADKKITLTYLVQVETFGDPEVCQRQTDKFVEKAIHIVMGPEVTVSSAVLRQTPKSIVLRSLRLLRP